MWGMSKVAQVIAWLAIIVLASSMVGALLSVNPPLMAAAQSAARTAATDAGALTRFMIEHPAALVAWFMVAHYVYVGMRELLHVLSRHRTAGCKWWRALVKPNTIAHAALGIAVPVMFVVIFDARPESMHNAAGQLMT